ncbi:sensor domain-containing diguanylate cyclase [Methylophaga sp.]|uniref:sensor domain-containing diguanylate cyclase n=1 Tax=Methylophaga sp. TaxID=2024840 RepID=UPI003F6A12D2
MNKKRLFKSLKQQIIESSRGDKEKFLFELGLRDALELWRVLFEQSAEGMVVIDLSGNVVEVNKRYADMLGYTIEEMLHLQVWDWDTQFEQEEIKKMLLEVDDKGAYFETKQRRKDGTVIEVGLSNNGATYKGEKLIFCLCRDITQQKQDQAKILRLAMIDNLTGLFNRHAFEAKLDNEINRVSRYSKPLSVLMYDLDHFKKINDNFGHNAGDAVLLKVAELVRDNIRDVDMASRWGGEEFLVLMPEADIDEAKVVAEKLRKVIAEHPFEEVKSVTASFGVTQFVADESPESFLKRVDDAMYLAKQQGRNCVETIIEHRHQ